MSQFLYVMQFKGHAAPVSGASNVLKASTTASSCNITTVVEANGVHGTLHPTGGGTAAFESQVTFTGETTFQESGSITFGEGGHRLHFSTVGEGYIGPSAEPGLQHGAVTWKIERGEGQLAGASGLITSNFFVSAAGEVTDNHFGGHLRAVAAPNQALEPTANSVRCAPAIGGGSPRAFGFLTDFPLRSAVSVLESASQMRRTLNADQNR